MRHLLQRERTGTLTCDTPRVTLQGMVLSTVSFVIVAFLCSIALESLIVSAYAQHQESAPASYASIGSNGVRYAGPRREAAYDLTEPVISIGLLAPLSGAQKAEGDAMVTAAHMALQDTSSVFLAGGRRVALVTGDESGPSWGHTSNVLIQLVSKEQVVAVVTSANGDAAHISEQVGNRLGIPILTLSSDVTTTQTNVPWIFRVGPSDALEAQVMAQDIYRGRGYTKVLLVTERDHDGRVGGEALQDAAREGGASTPDFFLLDPLQPDTDGLVARIEMQPPEAIIVWTQPETARKVMQVIWKAHAGIPLYLSQQAAQSGSDVEASAPEDREPEEGGGVWTVVSGENGSNTRGEFARRYRVATGMYPSAAATETYDAICLTVRALSATGPNRARIRDQIAGVKEFTGASGVISFDSEGNSSSGGHLVRMKTRQDALQIIEVAK